MQASWILRHAAFVFILMFSTKAWSEGGIAGGLNFNTGTNDNAAPINIDLKPGLGFQFGGFYSHHWDGFHFRAMGQFRTMRLRNRESGQNFQIYSMQLALPLTIHHDVTEAFGYFVGPDFAFNINDESELNDNDLNLKFNTITTSAMAGVTFRITKKLYIEFYYNHGLTDITENIRNQSFGFQFVTYLGKKRN